ncbi:MAG: lysozyme inhibitor LprI family protein [Pseudomonadota bacterium]
MKKVLACVLVMCGPAVSADDLQVDAATVQACFASAEPWGGVPDCVGDAANLCQSLPGGSSTLGIVECVMAETQVWDSALNAQYKATRAHVDAVDTGQPPVSNALLTAQRAWIAFRDAECALAFELRRGGTIRSVAAAVCQMRMTAARTIELRDMRGPM